MTNPLLLAVCYFTLMLAHAYLHAWQNEVKKIWINHWLHALYAGIAAGIVAYLFFGYTYCWVCSHTLRNVLYAVALYLAFRWPIHDLFTNLFRNLFRPAYGLPYLAFNYTGEIDGKDAWTDKLPRFKEYQYLYKAGLAVVTVGAIILIEFFTNLK